jgi:hypothetical protein
MRKLIRIALMWLIVVALPLQGVAAATMLHCDSVHQRIAAAGASHDHHHGTAEHRHGHAGHGSSSIGHHAADDVAADGEDASGASFGTQSANKVGCSSCAACSSGIALPTTPVVLSPPALVHSASPVPSFDTAVFLTDGPERPPRPFLASLVR